MYRIPAQLVPYYKGLLKPNFLTKCEMERYEQFYEQRFTGCITTVSEPFIATVPLYRRPIECVDIEVK